MTIDKHIREFTLEDVNYIKENYALRAKQTLVTYVSQEFNITNAVLNVSLLQMAPTLKRQLRMLDFELKDNEFEGMLCAVASYIFASWNLELQQTLGDCQITTSDADVDDFGDIDLF